MVRLIFIRVRQVLFYTFLLALPFHFQPFIAGVLFGKHHNDRVSQGIKIFMDEVDSTSWMDQWSVPGAPSIWDTLRVRHPFHIPQLRSNDWHGLLGLTIPHAHEEDFDWNAPIEKLVIFAGAVRDVSCRIGDPTEYWVYISSLAMPEVYEWDKTFLQLLEYHEMHPLPSSTSFAYIDCADSPFLCHIWQVQYPALVHFKIDEEASVVDDVDSAAFTSPVEDLRPVEVRIFDLGLQQEVSPLPNGIFPSMLAQMKALTANHGAYTVEEPVQGMLGEILRAYDQFNKYYYFPACNRHGSFLDYSSELDNWLLKNIAKPIGLDEVAEKVNGLAFLAGFATGSAYYWVANPVVMIWNSFLGQRDEVDYLADRVEERNAVRMRGGPLGDMAQNFVDWAEDWVEGRVESSRAAAAEQPEVTTEKESIKSMFAGLRANISSILNGS